jgi:hypothetical protein
VKCCLAYILLFKLRCLPFERKQQWYQGKGFAKVKKVKRERERERRSEKRAIEVSLYKQNTIHQSCSPTEPVNIT